MKKIIPLFALILLSITNIIAQKEIESLTYKNTQDYTFFKKVKNRTLVKKYTTINNNIIKIGDTIVLGKPTSEELNSRTYSGSFGNKTRVGIADTRTTSVKTYGFIQMGRPAGFGNVMTSLAGESQIMADIELKNTKVIVKEIRAFHRGSKKKPLYLVMVLGEVNGSAFGINKYLSVMDTELAIELGEVLLKNRKITREEAILKLKEAKDLVGIEMMTKKEFENLKNKFRPIIRGNKK
jgi:hypothetical protein